eukprot:TRINITY_DN9026_c0_g1_i4.p1 TRINITY_DN9026_c0_g1~~TRINITY_DN9026_c0_g1_i4.p1  ORF type:complete len:143 (-),score=60.29 TRINITY_DN9026_c0_g1_i4:172-600(-)
MCIRDRFYYKDALAAIIVYDITNSDTFEGAKVWINELREKGLEDVVMVLAGNKADMIEDAVVDQTVAKEYAESIGAHFMIVSAKDKININETFDYIARTISDSKKLSQKEAKSPQKAAEPKSGGAVKLDKDLTGKKASGKCC